MRGVMKINSSRRFSRLPRDLNRLPTTGISPKTGTVHRIGAFFLVNTADNQRAAIFNHGLGIQVFGVDTLGHQRIYGTVDRGIAINLHSHDNLTVRRNVRRYGQAQNGFLEGNRSRTAGRSLLVRNFRTGFNFGFFTVLCQHARIGNGFALTLFFRRTDFKPNAPDENARTSAMLLTAAAVGRLTFGSKVHLR